MHVDAVCMHCNFYSEIYWQKYSAYWQLKDTHNPKTPTTLKINHRRYKSCEIQMDLGTDG